MISYTLRKREEEKGTGKEESESRTKKERGDLEIKGDAQ